MKKQYFLILATSLFLTACGGSMKSQSVADAAAGVNGFMSYSFKSADFDSGSTEYGESAVTETAAAAEAEPAGTDGMLDVQENRKLIRNVSLEMETTNFPDTLDEISKRTEELGGYIESSGISGDSINSSGYKYANFMIRIPQNRLDDFLDAAAEAGSIIYKSENVEDVTLQYTDTESRIKSLKKEQERLWELLEQADSIDTVIALNQRLSEISYDLDSYESRLKTYDNQVDYSTVRLSVSEVKIYTEQSKDGISTRIQKGFKKNIAFLKTAGEDIIVWVASNILTIGIFVCILFLVVKLIRKMIRKKRMKKQPLEPVEEKEKPDLGVKTVEEFLEKK